MGSETDPAEFLWISADIYRKSASARELKCRRPHLHRPGLKLRWSTSRFYIRVSGEAAADCAIVGNSDPGINLRPGDDPDGCALAGH